MILFQPANNEQISDGERLTTIKPSMEPPSVRDIVRIGGNREWMVVHVESYYQDLKPLYLAIVSPKNDIDGDWTAAWMRSRSPDLSFYVQLSPNDDVLGSGYRMYGDHPVGRLYNCVPTNHPTRLQEVDQPWVTDAVDSYRPAESGLYSAVHICHCKAAQLTELAVA